MQKNMISFIKSNSKVLIAEAVGTLLLTLAVLISLMTGAPAVIVAPVALIFIVFVLGPISGAYVNPALTVGAWFAGALSARRAIGYIVAQCIGAAIVLLVAHLLPSLQANGTMDAITGQLHVTNHATAAIAEIVALVIFGFGVGSVVFGRVSDSAKPIVVGLSLMIALFVTIVMGGSIANPAVSIGVGSFSVARLLAPLVGSVIGFGLAKFINQK